MLYMNLLTTHVGFKDAVTNIIMTCHHSPLIPRHQINTPRKRQPRRVKSISSYHWVGLTFWKTKPRCVTKVFQLSSHSRNASSSITHLAFSGLEWSLVFPVLSFCCTHALSPLSPSVPSCHLLPKSLALWLDTLQQTRTTVICSRARSLWVCPVMTDVQSPQEQWFVVFIWAGDH